MKIEEMTVKDFLNQLASEAPVPGGGGVAALCGALGSALVSMVANLTVGKEKHRESWDVMTEALAVSSRLSEKFLELANMDMESFASYMAALKMPKETEEEKNARKSAVQEAAMKAAEIPLQVLELCVEASEIALEATKNGNPNVATDSGIAALLAEAGGIAASYNVQVNLTAITEETFKRLCRARMTEALHKIRSNAREVSYYMDRALG